MSGPALTPKQALRHELRGRLAALDPDERRHHAAAVGKHVMSLESLQRPCRVLSCLSYGTEIDTRGLIEQLMAVGHEVFVPRAEITSHSLSVHSYPCDLERLPFGLEQPAAGVPALSDEEVEESLDLVLILGLAFDRRGYRLGHGGGFFDRFLARYELPGVGLAHEMQIVDRLPVEPHDRPMERVITESGVVTTATDE